MKTFVNLLILGICSHIAALTISKKNSVEWINLNEAEAELHFQGELNALNSSWTWKDSSKLMRLQSGLPLILAGGQMLKPKATPFMNETGFWLPLVDFIKAYQLMTNQNLVWDHQTNTLQIQSNTLNTPTPKTNPTPTKIAPPTPTILTAPPSQVTQNSIHDIVLDPGHGGKDVGAVGAKSKEKDITLSLSLILKAKLEAKGFRVRMTRETDTLIELSERPKLASKWKGDLFLSIHCNSVEGKLRETSRGFKSFILKDASSDEDEAIARRENTFIQNSGAKSKDELDPVDWIEQEHQLNMYSKESEKFAKYLVNQLETQKRVPKMNTGAGQAGFMVLVGAYMPAVLLEIGFISHPKEEEILNSIDTQESIADKIVAGIELYNKDLLQR